jgi:hypothetical protein
MATKRTRREIVSDDHDIDVIERLTRLETEHLQVLTLLKESAEVNAALRATLNDVNARLTKYETRWGMIVMLVTAVGAALGLFKDWILGRTHP